jgi:hypothetical protein
MVLCDECDDGWHMKCLNPLLYCKPKGDWFCPRCDVQTVLGLPYTRCESNLILVGDDLTG